MKIRFLTSLAGKNFSFGKGAEAEIPNTEAKRFIRDGVAERMEGIIAIPIKNKEYYKDELAKKGVNFDKRLGFKKLKILFNDL